MLTITNNNCEHCRDALDAYVDAAVWSFPSPYSRYPVEFSYMSASHIRQAIWQTTGHAVFDPRLTVH